MGEVFLARVEGAAGFEKQVVIKKILPHLAERPDFVQRFVDEGKLLVKLKHASIAQVLDLGEYEGGIFLAMEYVDGRDLRQLMQLARTAGVELPLEVAVHVMVRVLEALDFAHRAEDDDGEHLGIIHRDVSPSNVMISKSGEVKLLDFGIARARDRLSLSVSGAIQGKFSYMSPQQAAGADLDHRSDQFSAGVMAWELLTGARPFDGQSDLQTLDRIRHYEPGSLGNLDGVDLPDEVVGAVDRMLSKAPEGRFDTAGDAARALQRYLYRVHAIVGDREVSAWVGEVLDTLPPGLRDRPAPGLSLDDALALGLGGTSPKAGTHTLTSTPAADAHTPAKGPSTLEVAATTPAAKTPAARTPSSPPTGPIDSVQGGSVLGDSVLGAAHPPDSQTRDVDDLTTPPPSRSSRSLLVAGLVVMNLLLLGAVGWLVFGGGGGPSDPAAAPSDPIARDEPQPEPTPDKPPVVKADVSAVESPAPDARGPAPDAVEQVAPAPSGKPGSVLGGAIGLNGVAIAKTLTEVKIVLRPPGASLWIAGERVDTSEPFVLREHEVVRGVVRATGYQSRQVELVGGKPLRVTLKKAEQKPPETGKVAFRFFPANAKLYLDGKPRSAGGLNVITWELPVGPHTLKVVSGGQAVTRPFKIEPNKKTVLKEIRLTGKVNRP